MPLPIQLSTLLPTTTSSSVTGGSSASDVQKSFSKELSDAFNQINSTQQNANNLEEQMVNGNVDNLHNVMIAAEKSEIMLQLAVQVRDKVINAYQEVMRMQV